jgi:UDP-N-acetylglucosamine--N-acetylmuramyl-(pentapeptide) pyrophosphoryl-undecaprenol N-acetylglucosamine transferase
LKTLDPQTEILFVGALGKMEMEKVPKAGYKIVGLPIAGIQRRLTTKNLLFPFKLFNSLNQAKKIVREFKPNAAVGVGGYASGPLLWAATSAGVPALIQEQNSYAGLTNKWLAKRVNRICVAYEGMEKFFPADRIIFTGNPVRQDIVTDETKKAEGLAFFGLNPNKKTILVIGGSLGARTINESIAGSVEKLAQAGVQVVWQTGKGFYEQALEVQKQNAETIKAYDFINRMDLAYAVADVVVSRAGALSVSELCLIGKASILVPSPNVSEDHQTKNAMALVNKNAAILVKDTEARGVLVDKALELLGDESRKATLSANIKKLAKPDAAKVIANEVINLIK